MSVLWSLASTQNCKDDALAPLVKFRRRDDSHERVQDGMDACPSESEGLQLGLTGDVSEGPGRNYVRLLTVKRNRVRCRLQADSIVSTLFIGAEASSAMVLWLFWRLGIVQAIGLGGNFSSDFASLQTRLTASCQMSTRAFGSGLPSESKIRPKRWVYGAPGSSWRMMVVPFGWTGTPAR